MADPGPLLQLNREARPGGLRVLAVGAHSDDLEIGAGGTLLRLVADGLVSSVRWIVLSAGGEREAEARKGAAAFLAGVPQVEVVIGGFRDGFFPYLGSAVKDFFEEHKGSFAPDLIFTHRRDDLHQDHRNVAELTWNTYRNHMILEYEIPKYDGDTATPNFYVDLPEAIAQQKIRLIGETFASQSDRHWFDPDVFRAVMRLRGLECPSESRFAEGFTCRKVVL